MIPTEIKVMIKDVLRGARFVLRHSSSTRILDKVPAPVDLKALGGRVADRAEETVDRLRHGGRSLREQAETDMRLYAALAAGSAVDDFEDRFRSAHYGLARRAFALRGVDNAYLVEHAFAEAARALLLADPRPTGLAFLAAAAVAVAAAAPVRLIDPSGPSADDPFVRSANVAAAAAVALAAAAWIGKAGSAEATDCLAGAVEMIGPLEDRLALAFRAEDPAATLAGLLETWAPFLP